jgi:UDP-3-O-[3-hydroxymyristoyl] N-acetylglucosamine deacetylase
MSKRMGGQMEETILIVDDEARIRSSLTGILRDEGFRVIDTGESARAVEIVEQEHPRLVLLDVWMPERDGIELLRQIKLDSPQTEVIMISGHGNIQSAVTAIKLGAADFIEKPFSVESLLNTISRVLTSTSELPATAAQEPSSGIRSQSRFAASFTTLRQKTINHSAVLAGQGLHSGSQTGVVLQPAPVGFGIVFMPLSSEIAIPAQLENVTDTGYNTTVSRGGCHVRTIEHLMSALHAFGITNVLIKTEAEIPSLDGSALGFCRMLSEAGTREQDAPLTPLRAEERIVVGDQSLRGKYLSIEPADKLIIDYTLEYPPPIGIQRAYFELGSPDEYTREIAPARTFGLVSEIHKLAAMGLARGGRLDNCILVGDDKVINTELRFANEFARHKVLDLIGDLYLMGRPVLGHVVAHKTGHSDNLALLKTLREHLKSTGSHEPRH